MCSLFLCLNSTIRLSADETIAYMAIKFSIDSQNLQTDLNKIAIWEAKLKMAFVTRNKNLIIFNYTLHGHPLELLEQHEYLGQTIVQDLKLKSHVNNVYPKANNTLYFLPRNINISLT